MIYSLRELIDHPAPQPPDVGQGWERQRQGGVGVCVGRSRKGDEGGEGGREGGKGNATLSNCYNTKFELYI